MEGRVTVMEYPPDTAIIGPHSKADAWDGYWSTLIRTGDHLSAIRLGRGLEQCQCMWRNMVEWGHERVLFAGSGISILPFVFEYLGFDVTSLDISLAATQYARTHSLNTATLSRFFLTSQPKWDPVLNAEIPTANMELTKIQMKKAQRQGGSVKFEVQDVLTSDYPAGAFDVVISHFLTDYIDPVERFANLVESWVRPGGLVLIETQRPQMGGESNQEGRLLSAFRDAGFVIHLNEAYTWLRQERRPRWWFQQPRAFVNRDDPRVQEFLMRVRTNRDADFAARSNGAKLAVFGVPPYCHD